MTRMAHDPGTWDYVTKRTQEGHSYREIHRSLKRYIARILYRQLNALYASAEPAPSHIAGVDGSVGVPQRILLRDCRWVFNRRGGRGLRRGRL